jgi:Cu(I)/Ag(I) efflux system membrane fusion protein
MKIMGILIGVLLGGGITFIGLTKIPNNLINMNNPKSMSMEEDEKKPLYWVAPMDAN